MSTGGSQRAITAPRIFDGNVFLEEHCLVVRDASIEQIVPLTSWQDERNITTLSSGTLAPGFIDLQVNGGGDVMFNASPSAKTARIIAAAHRCRGTTAILPTVISDTREIHQAAVQAVREARAAGAAGVLGIHIEGPFFAEEKRGAHAAGLLRSFTSGDLEWLSSLTDIPVMLTLAPERVATDHLRQLARSGILLCAGHTNATYAQLCAAAEAGISGVTHLYNAMSPLTSREPGVVGAALERNDLWAGIIADGHHSHPAAIRLAHRVKPAGKLVLVSDAMATVGGHSDTFEIYGESIRQDNGTLVNAQGNLAGSAIGLIDAVRYAHQSVGLPLASCLQMASLYPAAILGLQNSLGRLAPGYRADIVHFDDDFRVHNTWLAGQHAGHSAVTH